MTPAKTSGVLRVAASGAAAGAVLLRIWHGGATERATELQGSYRATASYWSYTAAMVSRARLPAASML